MSFLAAAGWALAVRVLFEGAVLFTESVRPGAITDLVSVTACDLLAYGVVIFAILRLHEPETSMRQALAMRPPSVLVLLTATVAGAALATPARFVNELFARRWPVSPEETEQLERLFATPTLTRKVIFIATLVVIVPIWEEIFFRGALFTQLKRGRPLQTVVVATAVYDTLMQAAGVRALASTFALALTLAWIRAATASAVPSVMARVAFFGLCLVPETIGHDVPLTRGVVTASAAVAALALVAIGMMTRRDPRTLEAHLDDG